jgi:hypothetical protein
MPAFRAEVCDQELGRGGLIGDLTDLDRRPISVITSGDLRRYGRAFRRLAAAPDGS